MIMEMITRNLVSIRSKLPIEFSVRMMSVQKKAVNLNKNDENDVLFEETQDKGLIILNRPKALNALNLSMVKKIHQKMKNWQSSKIGVILKGSGDKAFCAGGDVKSIVLALNEPGGDIHGHEFFKNEYRLNHYIGTYGKPCVSLINGIVMGGGVGLSVHGKYRVATENTLFAMPETAIGLYPDVGASHFLPRLKGSLGIYLGLTGHRLRGIDVLHAGIATHYVPVEKLEALTKALLAPGVRDIEAIIDEFQPKNIEKNFSLEENLNRINECFSVESVEEIIKRLKADGTEWSKNVVETLSKMSPTSLKITKLAIEKGRDMNLADCLKMEYRLSCSFNARNSDFYEGVRALLIDKDQNVKWNPDSLERVTDDYVDSFFNKIPPGGDLSF